ASETNPFFHQLIITFCGCVFILEWFYVFSNRKRAYYPQNWKGCVPDMTNMQKCGVIGVGFVGATCAYTLAVSGLFSEMVLVDMNHSKAESEAADINHGVSFAKPCYVRAGDYADLSECGLIIIAAGANQKPGETRTQLLGRNRVILSSIIGQVMQVDRDAV